MKVQSSVRARLCGVAVLMAVVAGCGGGGGGGDAAPAPSGPPPAPEVRGWANPFGSASVVIGQSGFDQLEDESSTTPATKFSFPKVGPAVDQDGKLHVVTGSGVYVFNTYDAMNGPVADSSYRLVHLGVEVSASSLSFQGQRAAATTFDDRVFVYDAIPGQDSQPHAVVGGDVGCSASTLAAPSAAYWTSTDRLIVSDTLHHRVLIWNNVSTRAGSLGDANVVLGQKDMNVCAANDDDGDNSTDDTGKPTGRTMNQPTAVWSDGTRLIVSDGDNNRVLVWDNIQSVASFAFADHVIGQGDFLSSAPNAGQPGPSGTTLARPMGIDISEAGELAITDSGNSRVLIWKTFPESGQTADFVVGQSDFFHGAPNDRNQTGQPGTSVSAKTLKRPEGARFHGRNLIVNDTENHRVLVWRESD